MQEFYDNTVELTLTDKTAEYKETVKANEMNPLASLYLSLLNLGSKSAAIKNEQKYIRIVNFMSLATFVGSLVYVTLAILWEQWYWLSAVVGVSLTCVAVLFMNGFGKTNLSRIIFLLGINALLFLNALFVGKVGEGETFFVIFILIPFLIFDVRNLYLIIAGVLIPVVCILSFSYLEPYFLSFNLVPGQQQLVSRIDLIMQFIMALAAAYQFLYYTRRAEEELESSNMQMSLQTTELKRSNSDLEQFAYIISHDLKAPVRNISSFMNLLVNKHGSTLNPEAREFVDYSRNGAKRMERLIDDVLSYCRIGTNLPKPTPVNMNDVVNTIRFELHDKLNVNGGAVNINRDLPVVNNVHSSLMYHVFQNLITNGLKFNKSEKPEVAIYWTNSLNYYTFSVRDNGIGISKEYSATIFQMFKRLHNENEYDGTGIGLAICKKIVDYYHGEIWFESEKGKGTTFHFTIRKF